MTDRRERVATCEYADEGVLRRLVRGTAATRPMTWLYIRIQQRMDRLVYRVTRGRTTASSLLSGLPVVMLTTTGGRTGQPRTVPVLAFPDADRLIVVASNYGRSSYPAWYHNLQTYPRATVTVDRVTDDVEVHELTGDERDRWFEYAARVYPGFLTYQQRASNRRIPVLRLDPT
jgi:deazaflavin-dependent oxidoreductase (nitroreductase family)